MSKIETLERIKNKKYQEDFIALELDRQKLEIQQKKDERIFKIFGFVISSLIVISVVGAGIYKFPILAEFFISGNVWSFSPVLLILSPFIFKVTGVSIAGELLAILKAKMGMIKTDL